MKEKQNSIDKTTSLHLNNEVQFLCFTLEEEKDGVSQLYAMNVFKIREIIYYDNELTQTAGDNSGIVLGYLTVRDETIPLVDMRRWLYYSKDHPERDLTPYSLNTKKSLVIICSFSNNTVGLKIMNVKRIIHKSWADINVGSEYGIDGDSKITATTKYDDGSVIQILDVERMLTEAFPSGNTANELELNDLKGISSDKVILLAEDSKPAAKSLQKIIEKLDLKYFTFPNGKALLDYLHNPGVAHNIGAIITDLEMPVMSGFEVLKRIKETPATCHIPVIINSSMSSDSNHQMAEQLHADGFISKSHPAEIEQALRQILSNVNL
ncbi:chemotaxis signal transduction protein CheV [Helicobacter jaachi]|uniref:Chemotaxis signal transduction protein CheV n=1 Tax=Helicobacter jaachi TaxID=1677920 RepID=A0A4U8TBH4_9HELI|nr:chemotaxis protein [Helicobacter jaachi]TLD96548.1 chemotaxis signal transduction protein CheV [Helicobacter jaachi]